MGLFEPSPLAIDYDPLANVAEFVIQYNQKHGTNHADFFQGSYAQVILDISIKVLQKNIKIKAES